MSQLKVIKLTEPGYENFTGVFGAINFTNGVSDYGVSPQKAATLLINLSGEYVLSEEDADLQAQLDAKTQELADLQAEFDAYKLAHPAA